MFSAGQWRYSNVSLTPSTTWAVVDLRACQVFSPASRIVLRGRSPEAEDFRVAFFAPPALLDPVARLRPLEADFAAERFLALELLLPALFFPRLADFLVAAI
jgi:hypothetical protein